MMLAVQACVCCRWYIPITARSASDAHAIAEVDPEDLVGPLACRHGRPDHLGFPQGRLRLGHAAQAVALDAQHLLDGGRTEPRLDLRLDRTRRRAVPRRGCGRREAARRAGSFADQHQQLDRHIGTLGELREGDVAERREALEGGRVEEVERDLAAPDGGTQAVQRDAGGGEACTRLTRRTSPA